MLVILTLEQLRETLDWWRPYLGLSDWEISLVMANAHDMEAVARSLTRLYHKELDIEIATAETRRDHARKVIDMEFDLLHEMLHGTLNAAERQADCRDDLLNDLCFEQPIEMLARSLVRLRRMAGPRFSWEQGE